MPIPFDIRKDLRFKEGLRVGREEARQEMRTSISLMQTQTYIVNMLRQEFGPLELIAELVEVDLAFVHKTKAAYSMALNLITTNTKLASISEQTGLALGVVENIKERDGVK